MVWDKHLWGPSLSSLKLSRHIKVLLVTSHCHPKGLPETGAAEDIVTRIPRSRNLLWKSRGSMLLTLTQLEGMKPLFSSHNEQRHDTDLAQILNPTTEPPEPRVWGELSHTAQRSLFR